MKTEIIKSQNELIAWDTQEKLTLIKEQLTKGLTHSEFCLFIEIAKSTGLNPLKRQIYAIKRGKGDYSKMTIQTGIDGYRSIASRSGLHMGTVGPTFEINDGKIPSSATVIVKKLVHGHVADFQATAYWDEYAQRFLKNNKMELGDMWEKFPKLMLGKCAEALALRRAFPEEMSGVYVEEEMQQADNDIVNKENSKNIIDAESEKVIEKSTSEKLEDLKHLVTICSDIAETGDMDAMRDWFSCLSKYEQNLIKPKLKELKKLCEDNSLKMSDKELKQEFTKGLTAEEISSMNSINEE